jgi:hypothetical protein
MTIKPAVAQAESEPGQTSRDRRAQLLNIDDRDASGSAREILPGNATAIAGMAVDVLTVAHAGCRHADRRKRGLSSPDPQTRYCGSDAGIKLPAGGIPEAPQRSENRCSSLWSRSDCLDALREFDALAAETPELRPTQKAYKAISKARGWPSSSTIAVHGGFRELLEEARRPVRSV